MKKYNIGLTFGSFCPLHFGHINLFINAKKICKKLIVCLSDDAYIKKHKGYTPPVKFASRKRHLQSIKEIDQISVQSLKFGKKQAVARFKPDALIVGSDWTPQTFTGANLGIPVVYLKHTDNISSTILRKQMTCEIINKGRI